MCMGVSQNRRPLKLVGAVFGEFVRGPGVSRLLVLGVGNQVEARLERALCLKPEVHREPGERFAG